MQQIYRDMRNLSANILCPAANGTLAHFKDVVVQDGRSFAVHDALAHTFGGRFTTIRPAAVERHILPKLLRSALTGFRQLETIVHATCAISGTTPVGRIHNATASVAACTAGSITSVSGLKYQAMNAAYRPGFIMSGSQPSQRLADTK